MSTRFVSLECLEGNDEGRLDAVRYLIHLQQVVFVLLVFQNVSYGAEKESALAEVDDSLSRSHIVHVHLFHQCYISKVDGECRNRRLRRNFSCSRPIIGVRILLIEKCVERVKSLGLGQIEAIS